jgi:predicted nucleic acid-binding protein
VAALIDTGVLVCRYDPRSPQRQAVATTLLRTGIAQDSLCLPHQVLLEFVSACTRPLASGRPLLSAPDARREAEELLAQFTVLYPPRELLRTAIRGAAAYELPWLDAQIWAYAECYGLGEVLSERFQHGRRYGSVQTRNPFLGLS